MKPKNFRSRWDSIYVLIIVILGDCGNVAMHFKCYPFAHPDFSERIFSPSKRKNNTIKNKTNDNLCNSAESVSVLLTKTIHTLHTYSMQWAGILFTLSSSLFFLPFLFYKFIVTWIVKVMGNCLFAYGRKLGELCRRDADCESGLICDVSAVSGASVCRAPMAVAKQYAEDCLTSSDCDITR